MRCREIRDRIERAADNSSGNSVRLEVESHCKGCPSCASAFDKAAATRLLFREAGLPSIPADLASDIMTRVHAARNLREASAGYLRTFMEWWAGAGAPVRTALATALFLFAAAGTFIGKDLVKKPESLALTNSPEMEAFSVTQTGSIEETYFQMTTLSPQGGEK
jgi:hypothetical protein